MAGIESPPYEIEGVKKNGDTIFAELSASTFKEDGKVIGTVSVIRDITERKKTREELKKKTEELAKMKETEKFGKLSTERELKMKELENRMKYLEKQLKKRH